MKILHKPQLMATWNVNTNGTRPSMSQNTILEVECPNLDGKKSQNRFVIPLNKNFSVSKIFTTSWSFAKCKYAHVQFFPKTLLLQHCQCTPPCAHTAHQSFSFMDIHFYINFSFSSCCLLFSSMLTAIFSEH